MIELLAAMSFYLVPALIGNSFCGVRYLLRSENSEEKNFNTILFGVFERFVFGALVIYFSAFLAKLVEKFNNNWSIIDIFKFELLILLSVSLTVVILSVIKTVLNKYQLNIKVYKPVILVILGSFVLALIIYTAWRFDSPSSNTLSWDIYHHQLLADLIQENVFSFIPSRISDTFQFNAYSTLFHVLLATPQIFFDLNVLNFWFYLEFFHLWAVIITSVLIAYSISKNRWIALIAGLISAFSFEIIESYALLFLLPQTLTGIISGVLIARVIYKINRGENQLDMTTIFFIVYIIFGHLLIGPFSLGLLLVISVWNYLQQINSSPKVQTSLLIVVVLCSILFIIMAGNIDLSFVNRNEAGFYTYDLRGKYEIFRDIYGYFIFILIPLGLLHYLRGNSSQSRLLVVLTLALLTVLLAPLPYSLKTLTVGRYLLYTIAGAGFWLLIRIFERNLRIVFISFLTVILFINLVNVFTKYKIVPWYKEISTHLNPHDLAAANFLKENYSGTNAMLVSDPATMHILEMLSGVNTPGGGYTLENTRRIISGVYFSRDSVTMRDQLLQVSDDLNLPKSDKILFAIGGRYEKWLSSSEENMLSVHWDPWTPHDLTVASYEPDGFIDFLKNKAGFKEVFRNDGIIIFEISASN